MAGFIMGTCCGLVQLWLLGKFTKAVTQGKNIRVIFIILKILLLTLMLLLCALFIRDQLAWAAAGITAGLVLGAFGQFIWYHAQNRKKSLVMKSENQEEFGGNHG
ncbi:MAG: hypothetical protein ACOYJC_06305 [Christensenellales bacterium]|jgi:hypothetical protein